MENRKHQLLPWAGPWLPPLTRSWLLRDSEPTPRPLGVHGGSGTGQDPLRRTSVREKGKSRPSKHSLTPPGHLPGGPGEQRGREASWFTLRGQMPGAPAFSHLGVCVLPGRLRLRDGILVSGTEERKPELCNVKRHLDF